MTLEAQSPPAPPSRRRGRSLDWQAWQLDRERTAAAACLLAYAAALWTQGGALRWLAAALVLDTVGIALPWRTPRRERGGASFWAETLVGMAVPVAAGLALAFGADWGTAAASWWWYAVALAVGAVLVLTGGMNLRALFSGDLAFIYGPTPRAHALARVTTSVLSPTGEEAVFRGAVITVAAAAVWPLGLLAAAAFVARHHLAAGDNRRGSSRAVLAEITAALLLLGLTVAAGSIWPALLAHVINNIPSIVFELQREQPAEEEAV